MQLIVLLIEQYKALSKLHNQLIEQHKTLIEQYKYPIQLDNQLMEQHKYDM